MTQLSLSEANQLGVTIRSLSMLTTVSAKAGGSNTDQSSTFQNIGSFTLEGNEMWITRAE